MNNWRLHCLIGTCILFFFATSPNADLIDQEDGTVLDTDRNIYWLKDGNLSLTNQFGLSCSYINCESGGMDYYLAVIQSPPASIGSDPGPSYIGLMNEHNNGIGWRDYNNWRLPTQEEFEHLYSSELGNTFGMPLSNTGVFENVQPGGFYWTGDDPISGTLALGFSFSGGVTLSRHMTFNQHFVWPVRNAEDTEPPPPKAFHLMPWLPLLLLDD